MIEASDIEKITAFPGGVEIWLRGARQGESAFRPSQELMLDWEAAQQLANELAGLCAENTLKAYRR
jgi:hypothetical protein